jgi:DNA-binding CsgD family transcriptional regulator
MSLTYISDKHISLASAMDMQQLSSPLFKHTPIKVFQYSRVYLNGARLELSNDPNHLKNVFIQHDGLSKVYTPSLFNTKQKLFLMKDWLQNLNSYPKKIIQDIVDSEHTVTGIGNQICLYRWHSTYCELFQFYTASNAEGIETFYLNNLDMLERFAIYFVHTAHHLILQADKDKIIKPWRDPFTANPTYEEQHFGKQQFIADTMPKQIFYSINGREIKLTQRDLHCASLLLKGKTARSMAQTLHLSQRSVESRLENLRLKTLCADRYELIQFLTDSSFYHLFLQ